MKTLPHNDDAERGVLSCCLQDPKCIGECIERIGDEKFFYDLRRERIYRILVEMFQSGKADFLMVMNRLKEEGILETIGGMNGLSQLQDYAPSTAMLPEFLSILEDKATSRKLIEVCSASLDKAYKAKSAEDILGEVERDILKVRPSKRASQTAANLVDMALQKIEKLYGSKGTISGLSTGLTDLDNATDGIHPGELLIISGYPSCGKTSLAMNIAENNFLSGVPVGILSAEMRPENLMQRSIYTVAKVNKRDVQWGNVSQAEFDRIGSATVVLSKSPVHIINAAGMTVSQAQAAARRLVQQHGIKLLVADYMQIFVGEGDNREREIASISAGFKRIAMEHNIGVILLSQLNDDGKIRESRAPSQDTDSHWKLENDGEWQPHEQPVKLFVEKNREGEAGNKIPLLFRKCFTKFENAAKIPQDL